MTPFVDHADILAFAEDRINLPQESVRKHREQVRHLRERLEQNINDNFGFGLVKTLYTGSLAKGTALSTINDVDVAAYLEKSQAPEEKDAVEWMAERLREIYPQKDPGDVACSRHCARINFRGTGLDVEIVPIIYEKDDWGHLVDKETGKRTRTNIQLHMEFIRRRKDAKPRHFAQIVRLVKWWAKQRKAENSEFRCKSFLLELLVARMVDSGSELNDYTLALEEFFRYIVKTGLEERVAFDDYYSSDAISGSTGSPIDVRDPVNQHNNVTGDYLARHRDDLVKAAEEAADAIGEAHYADKARAVDRWQDVLGPSFR